MTRFQMWRYLVMVIMVISGCSTSPKRTFSDYDLLIDQNVMPNNWSLAESSDSASSNEGQVSGAYINFSAVGTPYLVRGGEQVFRYSTKQRAAWQFSRFVHTFFNDNSPYRITPWELPDGFDFSSSFADKWKFACAGSGFTIGSSTGETSTLCLYMAQYEEFVISFEITTAINNEGLITLDQITPIIETIDAKIKSYLSH
jgi:hypothetical protein